MKDLHNKERYCSKIQTLLNKKELTPPSIDTRPYMDYPPPFLQEIPPSMIFQIAHC